MVVFADSLIVDRLFSQDHFIKRKQVYCKPYYKKRNKQYNPIVINNECNQVNDTYLDSSGEDSNRKLFIGGLHRLVVEQEMMAYFSKFGEIKECLIMRDKYRGKSRGIIMTDY